MGVSERRSNSRVMVALTVKVRMPDGQMSQAEVIRNISLGGVFIAMDEPLPFGSELGLEFNLPQAPRVMKCRGFVVWSTKTNPERSDSPGIGVRLMDIGITDMRILNEFIATELSPGRQL
jgi:uncharacterized protein (TIGR02266 family)